MKQNVYQSDFIDAFQAIRPENFSYDGLCALFDYFEQLEEDIGEEIELDVIAICCDYCEYASAVEYLTGCDWTAPERDDDEDDDDYAERCEEAALEELRDQTTLIEFDGGVIIQAY